MKMKALKLLTLASVIGFGPCFGAVAQEQTNQFLMSWMASGFTTNAHGQIIATNLNAQTLINKVAADNGLNPRDLCFVYRVEKLDTAVVYKTNGVFVSDVYQMEYTYQEISNPPATVNVWEALLNDEYHVNALGSTFGIEQKTFNRAGYLTGYSYHGTFHCAFPEDNVVFTGSFSTGPRVFLNLADAVAAGEL